MDLKYYEVAAEITATANWRTDCVITVVIEDQKVRREFATLLADMLKQPFYVPGLGAVEATPLRSQTKSLIWTGSGCGIYICPLSNPPRGLAISCLYLPSSVAPKKQKLLDEWNIVEQVMMSSLSSRVIRYSA